MSIDPRKIQMILTRPIGERQDPPLYAILDGARDPLIYSTVTNSYNEYFSLYKGNVPLEMAKVAPYIIRLTHESRFTDQLIQKAWGNAWGMFFTSTDDIENLRKHFRKFVKALDDRERPFYFRFYDPRVLNVFLKTCNEKELKKFFGNVARFSIEGDDSNSLNEYSLEQGKLVHEDINIEKYQE